MNAAKEQPAGYLCVFDREEFDTSTIRPLEPMPARFATKEQAQAKMREYWNWDRKSGYSVFEGAVQPYLIQDGKSMVNPAYRDARWEVRLVDASEYTGKDSQFELVEA